jgi:hypothetical protein
MIVDQQHAKLTHLRRPAAISPHLGSFPQEALQVGDPVRLRRQGRVAFGHEPLQGLDPSLVMTEGGDLPDERSEAPLCGAVRRGQLADMAPLVGRALHGEARQPALEGPHRTGGRPGLRPRARPSTLRVRPRHVQ